jgi:hypothetical protein
MMWEDIGNNYFVREVIEEAKNTIKVIYNHDLMLSFMRTLTYNKELVHHVYPL